MVALSHRTMPLPTRAITLSNPRALELVLVMTLHVWSTGLRALIMPPSCILKL